MKHCSLQQQISPAWLPIPLTPLHLCGAPRWLLWRPASKTCTSAPRGPSPACRSTRSPSWSRNWPRSWPRSWTTTRVAATASATNLTSDTASHCHGRPTICPLLPATRSTRTCTHNHCQRHHHGPSTVAGRQKYPARSRLFIRGQKPTPAHKAQRTVPWVARLAEEHLTQGTGPRCQEAVRTLIPSIPNWSGTCPGPTTLCRSQMTCPMAVCVPTALRKLLPKKAVRKTFKTLYHVQYIYLIHSLKIDFFGRPLKL